jgi:hypothetical protein
MTFLERAAVLDRFYAWLVAEGLLERNPAPHHVSRRRVAIPDLLAEWMHGWRVDQERQGLTERTIKWRAAELRKF